MQLDSYLETLRLDLGRATALADEQTRETAERLILALDAPLRLVITQALADAAAEVSAALPGTLVEVGMEGRDPSLRVRVVDLAQPTEPTTLDDEGPAARITLRLPDTLKTRVEALAEADGVSLNTWITNACRAAALPKAPTDTPRSGRRITGWA